MSFWLYQGDCVDVMRDWSECSVDALCSDPPYGLGFMNKKWDTLGNGDLWGQIEWHRRWAEQAYRVLKPGAHLLAFSSSRTYHYLAFGVELAGFEIRDSVDWIYGTGFPKSMNVGAGFGTALKPGKEPIVLARKPLDGTILQTVAKWGTGAINIDACRLGRDESESITERVGSRSAGVTTLSLTPGQRGGDAKGRWPANVVFDGAAASELDQQTGTLKHGGTIPFDGAGAAAARVQHVAYNGHSAPRGEWQPYDDAGGASRFFYCAKPSKAERDRGCEHLPLKTAGDVTDRKEGSDGLKSPRAGAGRTNGSRNHHPTLKPISLMRYLCRLITPPRGVVLDPFMGSGTTGVAALEEGFRFVGIERELEYLPIAVSRISHQGAT